GRGGRRGGGGWGRRWRELGGRGVGWWGWPPWRGGGCPSRSGARAAPPRSAPRSVEPRVYWYWVREARPPMRTSWTDCRKRVTPGTAASLGRRRAMISSAVDLRLA